MLFLIFQKSSLSQSNSFYDIMAMRFSCSFCRILVPIPITKATWVENLSDEQ